MVLEGKGIKMYDKNIFAKNLQYQMSLHDKTRKEVCEALDFNYFTFCEWIRGRKLPRMGSVEKLANYFGILKSDLIEEQTDEMRRQKAINKEIADLSKRMMNDSSFFETVKLINEMDAQRMDSLLNLIKK